MQNKRLDLTTAVELLQYVRTLDENGKVVSADYNEGAWTLLVNMTSGEYGISRKKVNKIFKIADLLERKCIIHYVEPVQKKLHK